MFRVLDLFCKAGGSGMGYFQAGFEVVGVDNQIQKHNPFLVYLADAIEFLREHGSEFDGVHASPPCQKYSRSVGPWRTSREYPDLINKTREALIESGKPYVIENVPGSHLIRPIFLNGVKFGLFVHRPRLFECSFPVDKITGYYSESPSKMGRAVRDGEYIQPVGHFTNVKYARKQMGIDWMTRDELSQAIPPAYTKYIGSFLMKYLQGKI